MIKTYDRFENDMAHHLQAEKEQKVERARSGWCSLGAVLGLSGGLITALTGSLLTAASWVTPTEGLVSIERTLGTILLVLTIPLLVFGAHCLDLREAAPKQRKRV